MMANAAHLYQHYNQFAPINTGYRSEIDGIMFFNNLVDRSDFVLVLEEMHRQSIKMFNKTMSVGANCINIYSVEMLYFLEKVDSYYSKDIRLGHEFVSDNSDLLKNQLFGLDVYLKKIITRKVIIEKLGQEVCSECWNLEKRNCFDIYPDKYPELLKTFKIEPLHTI